MRQTAEIEITGYLSKDGELRQTRDGRAVLGLTLPFTRRRLNKQTSTHEDAGPTLWAQFSLWDDAATHFVEKLRKGTPVHVKGIPELKSWEANGKSGVNLEIVFPVVSIIVEAPRQVSAPQESAGDWETTAPFGDDTPF